MRVTLDVKADAIRKSLTEAEPTVGMRVVNIQIKSTTMYVNLPHQQGIMFNHPTSDSSHDANVIGHFVLALDSRHASLVATITQANTSHMASFFSWSSTSMQRARQTSSMMSITFLKLEAAPFVCVNRAMQRLARRPCSSTTNNSMTNETGLIFKSVTPSKLAFRMRACRTLYKTECSAAPRSAG